MSAEILEDSSGRIHALRLNLAAIPFPQAPWALQASIPRPCQFESHADSFSHCTYESKPTLLGHRTGFRVILGSG